MKNGLIYLKYLDISKINVPRAEELVKNLTDLSKELKKNLEFASKNKKNMQIVTELNLRNSKQMTKSG